MNRLRGIDFARLGIDLQIRAQFYLWWTDREILMSTPKITINARFADPGFGAILDLWIRIRGPE
jgi:hypothetical protein